VCVCVCVWQDQQQTLAAIDALLQQQPITSQHLTTFIAEHPAVVGQQGIKDDNDDLSQTADIEQLSAQFDIDTADTTMPCDTADTLVSTNHIADTSVNVNVSSMTPCDADTADTSVKNNRTADTSDAAEHTVSTPRRHLSNRSV